MSEDLTTVPGTTLGEELVRLASADNFRDVTGPGYVATDGTQLRAGVFFRSNELGLTDEDAGTIAELGITDIYDLRGNDEVEAHPDVEVPGATWTYFEVKGIPMDSVADAGDRGRRRRGDALGLPRVRRPSGGPRVVRRPPDPAGHHR